MDIDRLDPKEAERRKEKRLCYECGQPGHFASEHRKNNGGNNHQKTYQNNHNNMVSTSRQRPTFQGQKFQGKKGKAPQKRTDPEKLRQHIRTLIDNSFYPESAEYEEFIKEVDGSTLDFPITICQTMIAIPKRKKMEISISVDFHDRRVVETKALIDSGAGGLFIDEYFTISLCAPMFPLSQPIPVYNVDGTPNKRGIIEKFVKVTVEIENRSKDYTFLVTALGRQWIILGYPWLEEENPDIDWR
jgi:hypothetical protein